MWGTAENTPGMIIPDTAITDLTFTQHPGGAQGLTESPGATWLMERPPLMRAGCLPGPPS